MKFGWKWQLTFTNGGSEFRGKRLIKAIQHETKEVSFAIWLNEKIKLSWNENGGNLAKRISKWRW
ncbi:MAG: hypothetical protein ACTS42_00495 [Candidatus Hodgkinia cicadicola]